MRKARRLRLLIVALPLLAMAAGSLVFIARVGRETERRLPEVIQAAASEWIEGTVSIGKVHITATSAVIDDLAVSGSADPSRPVIRIPRLKIKYGLSAIFLRKDDPIESIKSIELSEPEIFLERRADGSLSIADLIKPGPPKKPSKLKADIYLKSGKIVFRDLKPNPKKAVENTFTDVNASIDVSNLPTVAFTITGKGKQKQLERFISKGRYDTSEKSLLANIDFSGADAPYWSAYPWDTHLRVLSGRADGEIELAKAGPDQKLTYSGAVRVRKASLSFKQIHKAVTDVNVDLDIRDGVTGIRFQGKLGSSAFTASGHVLYKPVRLALEIASPRVNFRELIKSSDYAKQARDMALPTTGNLKATIYGPSESFGVSFKITAPSVTYAGIKAKSVAIDGLYSGERLRIRKASCTACGGTIQAGGDIKLGKTPSANLEGRISHLDLQQIPALRKQRITATTTGTFSAKLMPGTTYVRYRGKVESGQIEKIKLTGVDITLEYLNGVIRIQEISFRAFGGLMAVSGKIQQNGELQLTAAGSDINLASVASEYRNKPVIGRAFFTGEITGTLEKPVFRGEVEAHHVMASGVGVERISGSVVASRDLIDVDNMVVSKYPGTAVLSGRMVNPFSRAPTVHLNVELRSVDLEQILQSKGLTGVAGGMLSGQASLDGPISNPQAVMQLRVEGISYRDMPVDALEVQAVYERHSINLEKLDVQLGSSSLTASGNISKDGLIDINFSGEKLALSRFNPLLRPYAFVSGSLDAAGRVTGSMNAPNLTAEVGCEGPSVNGQKFTRFDGKASWDKGALVFSDISLSDGDADYGIPMLSWDPKSDLVELQMLVRHGQAQKVLAILDASPAFMGGTSGQLSIGSFLVKIPRPLTGDMEWSLSGSISKQESRLMPDLKTNLSVSNMKCGTSTISTVRMDASWKDEVVRLEKLEALDEDTNVEASGSFGPANELAFTVDAHNLTLDTLRQWMAIPQNISGSADVTIVASGDARAPKSEAFIELVDPVISGVKVERLRSRLSTSVNLIASADEGMLGRIDIDDVTLTLDGHDFRASGYIPVDWRRLTIPRDVPMLVRSDLDSDSLAVLSAFSGFELGTGPDGEFRGSVQLGGTAKSPELEGDIIWRDGQIKPPRMESALENVDAHIMLGDDRISVDRFTSTSAQGGKLEITGQVTLPDMKPLMDLAVKATDYEISGKNLSNIYGEVVKANINGDLKITGEYNQPLISGIIDIPKGSFELPARTQKQQNQTTERTFNPVFDIKRISLGKDVRFKLPRLNTPLYGNMALSGSLHKPVVEGAMDISGGTIQFPVHAFKIMQGGTLSLHVGSPPQPPVYIDMRAQTRLTAKSSIMRSRRYTVTMTARGPIDNLNPTFNSSPPGLPEESIMALVTGKNQLEQIFAQNGSGSMISGLFSTAMAPNMVLPIEEAFESALGFDDFSLQLGYHEPVQIMVSEQLLDGLYLDYSAALGARPDYADSRYELKLSRRFKYGLELGVQTDEDSTITVGIEGKLRF